MRWEVLQPSGLGFFVLVTSERLSCTTIVQCLEENSLFITASAQDCSFVVFPGNSYFERLVKWRKVIDYINFLHATCFQDGIGSYFPCKQFPGFLFWALYDSGFLCSITSDQLPATGYHFQPCGSPAVSSPREHDHQVALVLSQRYVQITSVPLGTARMSSELLWAVGQGHEWTWMDMMGTAG